MIFFLLSDMGVKLDLAHLGKNTGRRVLEWNTELKTLTSFLGSGRKPQNPHHDVVIFCAYCGISLGW